MKPLGAGKNGFAEGLHHSPQEYDDRERCEVMHLRLPSSHRMEQNALDTVVRKFANTVAAYNATQVEYDKNVKARVKGVLKTVLNKSDAELDEVIESGQSIEAIRDVPSPSGSDV